MQWAEKTTKLGEGIDVASVINLLLDKEDERSTVEARKIYSNLQDLECVWTSASLKSGFDVDHVIPFDLWHNNDSWNLLPASKKANGSKSNKLPSTEILKARKDAVIGYWEILRSLSPSRFDKEAETLLPLQESNWQSQLYGQMCNAIEVTALQRGVGRWPAVEKNG
ncbi:HNH nuclease [Burkholderiaceae bacterium]